MWKKAQFMKTRLFTIPWAFAVAAAHVRYLCFCVRACVKWAAIYENTSFPWLLLMYLKCVRVCVHVCACGLRVCYVRGFACVCLRVRVCV